MMEQGVEAVLARLVAQFPSPYDFVRELVQNAMDGGADRLEVLLDRHAGDSEDEVVYELRFEDTGRGMTQDVVREELTRLFASSKSGDRTSAGEFGVGFVSVFAWRPDAVLLQTGREGEAWELLFDGSATFEERPVDVPFEGTTITMFRRGRASEGAAIAEAVRDALWRWCRFCSLELSFEDLSAEDGPSIIEDTWGAAGAICEERLPLPGGSMDVSFAGQGEVVLARAGLILQEGSMDEVWPELARALPAATRAHLRVAMSSSELETNLARDRVQGGGWRVGLVEEAVAAVERLRGRMFTVAEDRARAARADWPVYAHAMAHLTLATRLDGGDALDELDRRPVIRMHGRSDPVSLRFVERGLRGMPMLVAPPTPTGPTAALLDAMGEGSDHVFPVVVGDYVDDLPWLQQLARSIDRAVAPLDRHVRPVVEDLGEGEGLSEAVGEVLTALRIAPRQIRLARLIKDPSTEPALAGFDPDRGVSFACTAFGHDPAARLANARLWLGREHPVVERAMETLQADRVLAAFMVVSALAADLCLTAEAVEDLANRLDRARSQSRKEGGGR